MKRRGGPLSEWGKEQPPERKKRARKYASEQDYAGYKPMNEAEIAARIAAIKHMRETTSLTLRQIAKALNTSFGVVQRALESPERHAERMRAKSEWETKRRLEDPEYAKKMRRYRRRYYQTRLKEERDGTRPCREEPATPFKRGQRNRGVWPIANTDKDK